MKRQFKCDLCSAPATFHQSELHQGEVVISHFCAAHQPTDYLDFIVSQFRKSMIRPEPTHLTVLADMAREFNADPQEVLAVMLESLRRLSQRKDL